MEKTGCKIICGATTTLAVKKLMMMMMMNTQAVTNAVKTEVWQRESMSVGQRNSPPQGFRGKWMGLKEAALNYPDQLDTHTLETTKSEIHVAYSV